MNKADITPDFVARLIAEQFPEWADLPVTPVAVDGHDNTTLRLGDEMSVRLPSADGYMAQVEKEQRWLPALASELPLPIPQPLAKGEPTPAFRPPWSVYRWLEGETASHRRVSDLERFAIDLAGFLSALYRIDPTGGPRPGMHNFFRGGDLATYDGETRDAIDALGDEVDGPAATATWETARAARWDGAPVWIHGDVFASNLLVDEEGRLAAVIDFGCTGIGDPACDLTIAWTFLEGESREAFRTGLALDEATWARARGWALWKALIMLERFSLGSPREQAHHRQVIANVLAEHARMPASRSAGIRRRDRSTLKS